MSGPRPVVPGRIAARQNLYRQAREAATWGIAVSLGLGLVKLVGGLLGHSLALVSDAAHSLVDATVSTGLVGALLFAQKPPDREHPYGHSRFEAVAGSAMALLLLGLALGIGHEALTAPLTNQPSPAWFTAAIGLGASLVQELLFRYARRVALRTNSAALLATAWDYRLDSLGGVAVVMGVLLVRWGGPSWAWADRAAAFFVAGAVLWVGANLLWGNVQDLMDRQADPELVAAIRLCVLKTDEIRGVETLRVRKVGLEHLVDIHIEVDPHQTVLASHQLAHQIKDAILDRFLSVRDVLVHVEPAPANASASSVAADAAIA